MISAIKEIDQNNDDNFRIKIQCTKLPNSIFSFDLRTKIQTINWYLPIWAFCFWFSLDLRHTITKYKHGRASFVRLLDPVRWLVVAKP